MGKKDRTEWEVGDPTISVVGERFCNPHPMELKVRRKVSNMRRERYEVADPSGNLLLRVDGSLWGFRRRRFIHDAAGLPVLNIRSKMFSMKYKWDVYGGENNESRDFLFSVKESDIFSLKTSVDVFLPHNSKNMAPDFRASSRNVGFSFKVFKENAVIAEVTHNFKWGKFWKGKHGFNVKVKPEVDYAFIIAILVTMDEINNLR